MAFLGRSFFSTGIRNYSFCIGHATSKCEDGKGSVTTKTCNISTENAVSKQTLPLSSRLYYYRAQRFIFSRGKNVGSASLHSTVGQFLLEYHYLCTTTCVPLPLTVKKFPYKPFYKNHILRLTVLETALCRLAWSHRFKS